MKCPECGSSDLSFDVYSVDHELIERASLLAEYNFCHNCGYSWFDCKEIEEKLKDFPKLKRRVVWAFNEHQVKDLFRMLRIQNKFQFKLKPFRKRTLTEMRELLESYEYKMFKRSFPALAEGVEEFYRNWDGKTK